MPAKLTKRASRAKGEWERLIGAFFIEEMRELAKQIRPLLMPLYQKTLRYWNQSGNNRFAIPSVIINTRIKRARRGVILIVTVRVVSDLWAWLDQGTPDIIQPTTSPPIPERRALRTTPDTLDVNPFAGYTGNFFVIRAGNRRRGIPPRNWTQIIAKLFIQAVRVKSDFFKGLQVSKVIVNGEAFNA